MKEMALVLFVNTWAGETFPLELDCCATVGDLKQAVEAVEGTPAGSMRLVHLGKPLGSNDMPLADTGISSQATVQMEAGSEDHVIEIQVSPQPRPSGHDPHCRHCRILEASCGTYRRVRPDPSSRTIDMFVRVPDDASPEPCPEMDRHLLRPSTYQCALGQSCWFYKHLNRGRGSPEPPCVRRQVVKGRTLPGGLSQPDVWELNYSEDGSRRGTRYMLRQDALLAEWDKGGGGPKSLQDHRHFTRGGAKYPTVQASGNSLETASLLKAHGRHRIE